MKETLAAVGGAVLVGVLSFFLFSALFVKPPPSVEAEEDMLVWMQREFELNPAQVGRIREIHQEYQPICEDHCQKILAARERLASTANLAADHPERTEAEDNLARLERLCRESTRAHVNAVAAAMHPAQAERFLLRIEPHLDDAFDYAHDLGHHRH
jgi:Spy/CpxP family protein refolding chaperone